MSSPRVLFEDVIYTACLKMKVYNSFFWLYFVLMCLCTAQTGKMSRNNHCGFFLLHIMSNVLSAQLSDLLLTIPFTFSYSQYILLCVYTTLCYHSILLVLSQYTLLCVITVYYFVLSQYTTFFITVYSLLFQVTVALSGMFGWWEGGMNLREEWKSALEGSGGLCVVIHHLGHQTMP